MWLFQDFLDQSKQLNQAPSRSLPAYHPPNKKYKIIHQALTIPNLPAPLHYLNFLSMIGQPNTPMFRNNSAIRTTPLDTATVLASSSPHMAGQQNRYSISAECSFQEKTFKFANKEQLMGAFPKFQIQRKDTELSFEIEITTTPLISHFTKLPLINISPNCVLVLLSIGLYCVDVREKLNIKNSAMTLISWVLLNTRAASTLVIYP